MKIKLIITVVALIMFIFGLGYFVWGIIYLIDGDLPYSDCPSDYKSECKPSPPEECYNGPIPGEYTGCGKPCPDRKVFNQPWSKYERVTKCVKVKEDCPGCCGYVFRIVETNWYSTADKLEPNCNGQSCGARKNGYLASGQCKPGDSGPFYKVCCNPDGTVGHSGPYFLQDNIDPPTEGVCLAPSRPKMVLSGLDTSIPPGAASTNCTTTVSTTPQPTPPPPPPSLRSQPGGICNPAIKIYVRKKGMDWQKWGIGRVIYNTSTTNTRELKKNDTLEFDVELVNRGTSISVECGYKDCELKCFDLVCINSTTNTTNTSTLCREVTSSDVASCTSWYTQNHRCNQWSATKTEVYVNNPDCKITSEEQVKVKVSLYQNLVYKFIDTDWSKYGVDAYPITRISFSKTFTFLNKEFGLGEIAEHEEEEIAQIRPQRHGTYYVRAEKTSGNVYNKPDEARTVGPANGIDKKYFWCQVLEWQNGGWVVTTSTGEGSFTLWSGEPATSVPVSSAQVEFYVKPTDVKPILNVTPPNITHPAASTTNRDYIAGYPITVEYGVQVDGYWGEDKGVYWLSGYEALYSSIDKEGGTQIKTTEIPLRRAGKFTITLFHNADDEKLSQINFPGSPDYHSDIAENEAIGNLESTSITIQVYRYLCYQGFCWECPDEPEREGTRLKVKEKGCKVVEDIKCQTYAYPNKSCKGGVRE